VSARGQFLLTVSGHFHVRPWAVFHVRRHMLMFIALHLVPSNYNMVEHAVSDYVVGRTRRLSSIMTWTTAAFWAALALATIFAFPNWDSLTSVVIRLVALTVIFVALPFLQTDLEGSKATAVGRLHLVAAVAWSLSATAA